MVEVEDSLDSGGRCTFLIHGASTLLTILVSHGVVSLPLLPSLVTQGLVIGILVMLLVEGVLKEENKS